MSRTVVLAVALAFTALLLFLTVYVLVTSGIDVLVAISLLVLALLGSGILGALTHPPPDR
jgi:hypothetical protein